MTDLLQPGVAPGRLLLPSALLLGILHGLEPGQSKTMMTAFIIAVRGTIVQAVLLGLAATVSHTAVVWVAALIGMNFGSQYNGAAAEPYLQLASAALIVVVAAWMLGRAWRERSRSRTAVRQHAHHHHHHGQHHALRDALEQAHEDEIRRRFASRQVTTGHIVLFGLSGGLIPCSAAVAVPSGKPDLARCRASLVLQHWTSGYSDRGGDYCLSGDAPTFDPLAGFRSICAAGSLPFGHRHDQHRPICRLARLD